MGQDAEAAAALSRMLCFTTGVMGLATAKALQSLGYKVSGWSRSTPDQQQQQQQRAGISSYVGQQQLQEFVSQQDVVVCLLPLTAETTGGWAVVTFDIGMRAMRDDPFQSLSQAKPAVAAGVCDWVVHMAKFVNLLVLLPTSP
jgi:hypothetical protein